MSLVSRRLVLGALAALPFVPTRALALSEASARATVERAVAEINQIISAGGSEGTVIRKFAGFYGRYADQPSIAAAILGPPGRSATRQQRAAFSQALSSYLVTKYGRRFREFVGGSVAVQKTRALGGGRVEVVSIVNLRGRAPFEVSFFLSDRAGSPKFYDMRIEGISMLRQEGAEIGAMLDRNRGNIDALIAALRAGA